MIRRLGDKAVIALINACEGDVRVQVRVSEGGLASMGGAGVHALDQSDVDLEPYGIRVFGV